MNIKAKTSKNWLEKWRLKIPKTSEKKRLINVRHYQKYKEQLRQKQREYREKTGYKYPQEKVFVAQQKHHKKYPEKYKARNYAFAHKQRRPYCLFHLLEGEYIKAIEFHHTDYEGRMGFSVCDDCHTNVHNQINESEVIQYG